MSEKILINRYASRRLYNTQKSEYVTLDEVAELIRAGSDVEIRDRKTGEDITRQYLLQIITEQESRGETVLPVNVLTDLVRAYSTQAQSMMPEFLANSLEMFKSQQEAMVNEFSKHMPDSLNPMKAFEQATGWQQKQQNMLGQMMSAFIPVSKEPPESASGADHSSQDTVEEMAQIKAQLAALQSKLDKL